MRAVAAIAIIFAAVFFPLHLMAADESARPVERMPPMYPDSCLDENGNADTQIVNVIFDINVDGLPENIRIHDSTDECYDRAAIAAVEKWRYAPRMVDGKPARETEIITRITFEAPDRSVPEFRQLLKHVVAQQYPEACSYGAGDVEYVKLRYDISADGTTENIEVIESTRSCLNKAAIGALAQWLYHPQIVDGVAVERTGVEVKLFFELE